MSAAKPTTLIASPAIAGAPLTYAAPLAYTTGLTYSAGYIAPSYYKQSIAAAPIAYADYAPLAYIN